MYQWDLFQPITRQYDDDNDDDATRLGRVLLPRRDGNETKKDGLTFKFDTNSNVNKIKLSVFRNATDMASLDNYTLLETGTTEERPEEFYGKIELRWWLWQKSVRNPKIFPQKMHFSSKFFIVQEQPYDVVVGLATINEERLRQENPNGPTRKITRGTGGLRPESPVRASSEQSEYSPKTFRGY